MTIMEQSSSNKLPYWLEDLTNAHDLFARSLSKPRPQSWRPTGQSEITNIVIQERRAITTPGRVDVTPVKKALLGLQLDDVGDITPRAGSALFGRRAVASTQDPDITSPSPPVPPTPTDELNDLWDSDILPLLSPRDRRPNSRVSKAKLLPESHNKLTPLDKSLEESWSSLSFFNRKHRGRLSRKIEGDDVICAGVGAILSKQVTTLPVTPEFVIPELPTGRRLEIDITATWGDRHYLGMNGFEIFSVSGELVQVAEITAEPADINILPEYHKDPRVVANLLDGVNRTRDDMHLWLAPFTEGAHHYVRIKFVQKETIAMIRIWNYNKSRIHSYRGVKDIRITLDGEVIFLGEIARACGGILGGTDAFGDTVLFTTDEDILERVSQHDDSYDSVMNEGSSEPVFGKQVERPLTASVGDIRPLTCAGTMLGTTSYATTGSVLCTECITLHLLENWGHEQLIGLTGIQVLGETGSPVSIAEVTCSGAADQEALNRLLDGTNETTDSRHMWTAELDKGSNLTLRFGLATPVHITAVTLWNYNSSLEMSYCGVKQMLLKLDDHALPLDNGILTLRRAPGHCHYSFAQLVPLVPNRSDSSLSVRINSVLATISPRSVYEEEYESPEMPRGFVFQLLLLSTWGDPYYVGLNGIQMYDSQGSLIHLSENNVNAYPHSVNVLEDVDNDVRTPDKLIDGVNDTKDGCHMWLAPILPGEILVDDLLVYNGVLDTSGKQGSRNVPYRTVIFASNSESARRERATQITHHGVELSLFDEHRARSRCSVDQSQRPLTSLRPPSTSSSLMNL